ncbi:MAG TPA: PIN domain-containing protein [Candidatus Acidoferrum sp.]|nr:PIN domain-containing protein [Candidatus Acidoferrum sp.]
MALGTNVLAYAEGINGTPRKADALDLLQRLPSDAALLPVQILGELFQLLLRKLNRTPTQARAAILGWRDAFPLIETSEAVILGAAELAASHRFSFWDGVVLASAAEGGCRLLLSEDLQDGFTWNGVTVANPFGPTLHPLLNHLLS